MKRKSSTTISAKRQTASDTERFSLYKPALDEFMTPFFAENRSATPPNPQEVANAVARVIAQPAGERPLRTVVATAAQHQTPQEVNGAATHATQSLSADARYITPGDPCAKDTQTSRKG